VTMPPRQSSWKFADLLSPQGTGYYHRTQQPLHCLVFLAPALILFELGVLWRDTVDPANRLPELVAGQIIEQFIELLGASGSYFPGLLLVAILLAWHLATRHNWRIDLPTLAGMLGESVVWAVPLYAFNTVLQQARAHGATTQWIDNVILSIGAGIYEELVFRLIVITLLSLILVDVLNLNRNASVIIVLFASATLFAAHHHEPFGTEPFDIVRFLFRTGSGLYLAGIFVFRGFGIAAGAHAVYDIVVVTIAATGAQPPIGLPAA
jgi:hypothetical protein